MFRGGREGPPPEHAFLPEASTNNTVGTLRRNTIGTLNQCSEPAFRDQLRAGEDCVQAEDFGAVLASEGQSEFDEHCFGECWVLILLLAFLIWAFS